MNRVTDLQGKFAGEEEVVFVLGAGPSLNEVPLEAIDMERAIACNSAIDVVDAAYTLMVDPGIWDAYGAKVAAKGSKLIASDNIYWPLVQGNFNEDDIYTFGYRLSVPPGQPKNGVFHRGWITGYYAAEIAAMMTGYQGNVILCGQDLGYTPGKPTHAAGGAGAGDGSSDQPFIRGVQAFVELRKALEGRVKFFVVGESALVRNGFEQITDLCEALSG